jgi:hypothetical protein
VDDDAVADDRMRERCPRADVAIATHNHFEPNNGAGRYRCSRADRSFPPNDGTRLDGDPFTDPSGRIHERTARIRASTGCFAAQSVHVEQAKRLSERARAGERTTANIPLLHIALVHCLGNLTSKTC